MITLGIYLDDLMRLMCPLLLPHYVQTQVFSTQCCPDNREFS